MDDNLQLDAFHLNACIKRKSERLRANLRAFRQQRDEIALK